MMAKLELIDEIAEPLAERYSDTVLREVAGHCAEDALLLSLLGGVQNMSPLVATIRVIGVKMCM